MDPVTGLSSRSLRILVAVVAFGVIAATLATASPSEPICPDTEFGCATFQAGEPLVLGVLVSEKAGPDEVETAVRAAIDERGRTLAGRPLRAFVWRTPCTAEGGAEGARELATDPLDEPPTFAVIADACPAAILPAAQILADSGRVLVTTTPPPLLARNADTTFDASGPVRNEDPAALVSLVLDVASDLALEREDQVLIPRTQLRLALQAEGLSPAPHR